MKKQTAGLYRYMAATIVAMVIIAAIALYMTRRSSSQQVLELRQRLAINDSIYKVLQTGMRKLDDTAFVAQFARRP